MIKRLTTLALAGAIVLLPNSGSADVGDGDEDCNQGEICFYEKTYTTRYTKQFWYGGTHDNLPWWDKTNNDSTGRELQNDAERIANRDNYCDVKVIDDRGYWADDVHQIDNVPDEHSIIHLSSSVDNENDRHERC